MSGTYATMRFIGLQKDRVVCEYDVHDANSTFVLRDHHSGRVLARHNVAADGPSPVTGRPWRVLDLDTGTHVGVDLVDEVLAVRDRRR